MSTSGSPKGRLTRRRFVGLVAASSAAWVAAPGLAAPSRRPRTTAKPKPAKPTTPDVAQEIEHGRASTRETLKTVRAFKLPPGGDLSVVFVPMRGTRKGR